MQVAIPFQHMLNAPSLDVTDTGFEQWHLWTSICYRFVGVMDLDFSQMAFE